MIVVDRRGVFSLAIAFTGFAGAGCLDRIWDDRRIGAIEGWLVDDAPSDAPITESGDDRIADVTVIQELLERATDPALERMTVRTRGDEYEAVVHTSGTAAEMRDAARALDELSWYENERNPSLSGTYLRHRGQVVVVNYLVLD